MSKITDYSFLFQSMFGTKSNAGVVNPLKVSDLSNGSLRSQLKAAGIDTNSAQYKAAVMKGHIHRHLLRQQRQQTLHGKRESPSSLVPWMASQGNPWKRI